MKKLNFNFQLKDLSGKPIDDSNAGKLLANVLANDTGKNPIKFFAWGQLFFSGQSVEIDNQDVELLKTTIMESQSLTAMSKAQLLEVINEAKAPEKAKD